MGEAGGISSSWWVTSTMAASGSPPDPKPRHRPSRPPGQTGGRFVEEQQFGVGHQGAGDHHRLRSPSDSVP
jgi:hypothetical protein